jgi:hypothetical protein
MADYRTECKRCGAQVLCEENQQVYICPYCESKNTIARSVNTQGGLFNRANHLRRANEFDKAIAAYEEILRQDDTEYEAHWGIVLCRYGIEYVEDPATGKRVPTCHRAQYDSIIIDPEYLIACEYAPYEIRSVYETEAAYINAIQKNILAIAQKQEKYDVFICYKETDEDNNRTKDSVLAQELYDKLTSKNFLVFFARKTLEGKLGSSYEPIIFSAINSASVMIVVGTKPEHFNAVWVKNEWSRYRELVKKDKLKVIIPAYCDMSPYDLPQEFLMLQSQDMSKLGFAQDICDGVERFTRDTRNNLISNASTEAIKPSLESLLRRAQLFLEDADFTNANQYIEKTLDISPEYAPAYIYRLMAQLRYCKEEDLSRAPIILSGYPDFNKALRFSNMQQKIIYEGYQQSQLKYYEGARLLDAVVKIYRRRINQEKEHKRIAMQNELLMKVNPLQEKLKNIEQMRAELHDERYKLGLFAMNKKKIIENRIFDLDMQINQIKDEISRCYKKP